ncbi:hypothetical protein Tco_0164260 [Tanacetum coccineum]
MCRSFMCSSQDSSRLDVAVKFIFQSSRYVVPTGRVVVPTGRYVVPAGKVIIIVSPGRLSLVSTGQSVQTVHMLTKPQVFYDNNLKQALGFQNPFYLKKAQQIRPILYDGSVITKETNVISIADYEETLMLEEESQSTMLFKQSDPMVLEKKLQTSHLNTDQSASSPVKIEAPWELPKIYKQFYDSIKPSCVRAKEHVESLVNQLNQKKFKGKDIVDNAAQVSNATTITPGMYKLDPVTLAPKDKNNKETHIYYLKHTMEQAAILKEIVEQAKSLNPLDSASYSACKSKSTDNTKNDKILQISSSIQKKNKVEDHSRIVNSMFDARHELCFLEFVSDMNASSKSKSVKKAKKKEEWKPTGKVFTKIRYNWRPIGRTFTLVVNACPLTRITNKVPLREPIPLEVVAQEYIVTKVYIMRPKVPKTNGSNSKPKITKSVISNKTEPVPVPLPEDPYEAIRQAYLDGTNTEFEPFEDLIDTETLESPLAIAPPITLSESTPPVLVPILYKTARMVVRVPPAMSSGRSASMAGVAAISESVLRKRFRSSYESSPSVSPPYPPSWKSYRGTSKLVEDSKEDDEEEDEEIKESMDSDSVSEDAGDEGPTTKDEDPAVEDEGHTAGVEGPGMHDEGYDLDDERHGRDDESRGIDDEGHSVKSDGLGLEEDEEVVPGVSSRQLRLFRIGPESERPERVSTFRQPTLTTWTDPEDGMIYIDILNYPPPAPPVQTPPSPESLEYEHERVAVTFGAIWRPVLARKAWAGQTDAQRAALWHAISDVQGENQDLRLQLAEERRARLELAEVVLISDGYD